jgi:hypothetical protein
MIYVGHHATIGVRSSRISRAVISETSYRVERLEQPMKA